MDAGAEQHLDHVDQAGAGDDGLVEQQGSQRRRAAPDPGVRGLDLPCPARVLAQRVGAEPGTQRGHLRRGEQLARRRAAQIQPVPAAGQPQPHLPDRRRRRPGAVGEAAVQAEVYVQCPAAAVVVQQVLAVRLGVPQQRAGQRRGAGGEPALRAAGGDPSAAEQLAVPGGEAVDGVSLGHEGQRYPTPDRTAVDGVHGGPWGPTAGRPARRGPAR
jgi:hypothetical protein